MIKLLIVDDEEEIRSGIRDMIEWEANGIYVCGEASNGIEAIDCIDEFMPDIILIDIRMPLKSGLDVIETIHQRELKIKTIVLSGYDDFSYAQKSLKCGASDYLLKPCRPQEILSTVLKAKEAIEEERLKRDVYARLKVQFNKSLPILKEKYLARMIAPDWKHSDKVQEDFRHLNIFLGIKNFVVLAIRIDGFSSFSENKSSTDIELMKFAVKNITEETLLSAFKCEVFENNNDLIAIANVPEDVNEALLLQLAGEIKCNVANYLNFSVSIGLGTCYADINSIYLSYNEAVSSIDAAFIMGPGSIIKYADIYDSLQDNMSYPISEEKEILLCIRSGDKDKLRQALERFFHRIASSKLSKDYLLKSSVALLLSLYHLCIEMNFEVAEILGQDFSFFNEIDKLDNLDDLKEKLFTVSEALIEKVNSKKGNNRIIDITLKFIQENFSADLNLETVAKNVYITPGYLSMLFKQSVGVNFVDYLHKVRIEKACEILKDVRLKTYEVAFKVGYSDEKYFAQIFKKITNMTPTQYRESKF